MAMTRIEFKVPKVKIGDIVEVKDGIWASGVSEQGEKVNSSGIDLFGRRFKVTYISKNKYDYIPARLDCSDEATRYNNTILKDSKNGNIIFIDDDYLQVIKPIDCPCDRCCQCD